MILKIKSEDELLLIYQNYFIGQELIDIENTIQKYDLQNLIYQAISSLQAWTKIGTQDIDAIPLLDIEQYSTRYIHEINFNIVSQLDANKKAQVKDTIGKLFRVILLEISLIDTEVFQKLTVAIFKGLQSAAFLYKYDSEDIDFHLNAEQLNGLFTQKNIIKVGNKSSHFLCWQGTREKLNRLSHILVKNDFRIIRSASEFRKLFGNPDGKVRCISQKEKPLILLLYLLNQDGLIEVSKVKGVRRPSFWKLVEEQFVDENGEIFLKHAKNKRSRIASSPVRNQLIIRQVQNIITQLQE